MGYFVCEISLLNSCVVRSLTCVEPNPQTILLVFSFVLISMNEYKLSGSDWQNDSLPEVAKNGYRVLLTRARKGMVIFVPRGDLSGEDKTRDVDFYDGVWEYLKKCGAKGFDN